MASNNDKNGNSNKDVLVDDDKTFEKQREFTQKETLLRNRTLQGSIPPRNRRRDRSSDNDSNTKTWLPWAQNASSASRPQYIQDRRGNCITMPFLFVILGQRLGLDATPAMVPLHVFVKFTDDQGVTHYLEATSGAERARDQHYRDLLPITDAAVSNGVFLTPLDAEQSVAVIAAVIVEELIAETPYHDAMAVTDILIEHYPMFAYIMVKKATASYHLLRTEFHEKYPTAQDVPEDQRPYLAYLQWVNQVMFDKAESLGWRALER
jgi:hypothetical protein